MKSSGLGCYRQLGDEDTECNGSLLIWLVLSLFDMWYVQV